MNSPNGVMCLQEMAGSGFPLAVQMSDTLLPSFTVMSEEMSYILGGTVKKKDKIYRNKIGISNLQPLVHTRISSMCNITIKRKIKFAVRNVLEF